VPGEVEIDARATARSILERIKGGKEHAVPLRRDIIAGIRGLDPVLVFPAAILLEKPRRLMDEWAKCYHENVIAWPDPAHSSSRLISLFVSNRHS
jgi:hypothetical protein